MANVDARTISYVEATANGSPLGDALEFAALTQVFGKSTGDSQFCSIGAAKSGIGHAEAASGISQLTKTVMQLQHRQLVPVVGDGKLNPKINLEGSPFRLQRVAEAWKRPILEVDGKRIEVARRALVSSYGTGGTYVSLLLEEAPEATAPVAD